MITTKQHWKRERQVPEQNYPSCLKQGRGKRRRTQHVNINTSTNRSSNVMNCRPSSVMAFFNTSLFVSASKRHCGGGSVGETIGMWVSCGDVGDDRIVM